MASACTTSKFSRGLVKDWSTMGLSFHNLNLEDKGNPSKNGLTLIEKKSKSSSSTAYYLLNSNGDSLKLDIDIDGSKKLLYFEFIEDRLFAIINVMSARDRIEAYTFDLKTGLKKRFIKGQIPCMHKTKADWSLGNTDCEWINFKDNKLALIRGQSPFEYNLLIYDWSLDETALIETELKMGLSALNGYIVDGNIYYDKKKISFVSK